MPDDRFASGRSSGLIAVQVLLVAAGTAIVAADASLRPTPPVSPWAVFALVGLGAALGGALWMRWTRRSAARTMAVLVTDIVAITVLRTSLLDTVPAVSLLATLPIIWLAGGYPRRGGLYAAVGALAVILVPRAATGTWTGGDSSVIETVLPDVALLLLAVATNLGARVFWRQADAFDRVVLEREHAREQALVEATLARTVMENLDAGIAVFAPDGTLRSANAAARRFAMLEGIDLASMDVRPTDPERALVAAIDGREMPRQVVWVDAPDRPVALATSAHHVRRDDGRLIGTLVLTLDMSDSERTRRMRHDFLASASHELRTPLTPIIGHMELLADAVGDDERAADRIRVLQRNVDRLAARIDELAAASDLDPTLLRRRCDLGALAAVSIARHRSAAADRKVELRSDIIGSLSADADPRRFGLALDALLGNALKFSPPGSTVHVTMSASARDVTFTVADEGPGIPPDEAALVFEPFFRGRYAHDNAIPGFGLGLAQCAGIVRAHRGTLTLEPDATDGTTIRMVLPRTG